MDPSEEVDGQTTEGEGPPPSEIQDDVTDNIAMDMEEEILEEENKILDEEEREKTLAAGLEDTPGGDLEAPEVVEFTEEVEEAEPPTVSEYTDGEKEGDRMETKDEPPDDSKVMDPSEDIRNEDESKATDAIEMTDTSMEGGIGGAKEFLGEPSAEAGLLQPKAQTDPKKAKIHEEVKDKGDKKPKKFDARRVSDKTIFNACLRVAPKHDYFGLIFSAESKRPPNYYHNYFLPVQKQPRGEQHMKILGKVIPTEVVKPFITAPTHALPLSTVKLRWKLNIGKTVYKPEDIYAYLSRYGPIERVYQVSNNSALVEFTSLEHACQVVRTPGLGYPWDPLIADWLEPRMNNLGFFKQYTEIEEKQGSSFLNLQT